MDYERGLKTLKDWLQKHAPDALSEYLVLEARLLELQRARSVYGDSENVRTEFSRVILSLNEMALKHCKISFNDLCQGEVPEERPQLGQGSGVSIGSIQNVTDSQLNIAGRDLKIYQGDVVYGDKVLGEKISGDKIGGDRYDVKVSGGSGIAIGRGAQAYVPGGRGTEKQATPPEVSVDLLTRVFPTAYSHLLPDAETFPFVTATVDNSLPGCVKCRVRLSAEIQGYSEPAVETPRLAPGERLQVPLLPVLQSEPVKSLTDIRLASLLVKAEQVDPEPRLLYEDAERIHLQGRDVALLAIKKPDETWIDHHDYLAAWVTPRATAIERLLRKAFAYHPDGRFDGYQRVVNDPNSVRTQAQAIFDALKHDAGLVYVSAALSLGGGEDYYTQRVRLPSHILDIGGSANCMDATVLFASLLELVMIEPLIAMIPGHAFLGWRLYPGGDEFEFLDAARTGSDDFETARDAGRALIGQALEGGWRERPLFDPQGYLRLVDVAACRKRGIYTLE